MGFFSNLFRMRSGARTAEAVKPAVPAAASAPSAAAARVNGLADRIDDTAAPGAIWDTPLSEQDGPPPLADAVSRPRRNKTRMLGFDAGPAGTVSLFDDDADAQEAPETSVPLEADATPAPRIRRNKTRMIGFETSAGQAIDLFAPDEPADAAGAGAALGPELPVGWVVVTTGPERGTSITLTGRISSIGTGAGHEIGVDTGTPSLTAKTHGTIHHDPEGGTFSLAPAQASAPTSAKSGERLTLNGEAVTAPVALASGDTIGVGTGRLHFVALCTGGFRWDDQDTGTLDEGKGGANATQA